MMVQLSAKEAAILLGATLMHWGVPFRFASKRELSAESQVIVGAASEKLMVLREAHNEAVNLSAEEISLLIEVVEDCLAECGNDATELSLQLKTDDHRAVEALSERLRGFLLPSAARP